MSRDSGKAIAAYVTLKYLNTTPRVSYLARIKNPNPKMPGADRVGTANGLPHGHGTASEGAAGTWRRRTSGEEGGGASLMDPEATTTTEARDRI